MLLEEGEPGTQEHSCIEPCALTQPGTQEHRYLQNPVHSYGMEERSGGTHEHTARSHSRGGGTQLSQNTHQTHRSYEEAISHKYIFLHMNLQQHRLSLPCGFNTSYTAFIFPPSLLPALAPSFHPLSFSSVCGTDPPAGA